MSAPFRAIHLGGIDTRCELRPDGSRVLTSGIALQAYPRCLGERLQHWAEVAPDRVFLAQRGAAGDWIELSYAETLARVRRLAQALLDRGLNRERGLLILSENSLEHALLGLAAMHVGVPYTPVSTAYSLVSGDFAKLRHIAGLMTPGLVYASDGHKYGRALAVLADDRCELLVSRHPPEGLAVSRFDDLQATPATPAVDAAFADLTPDTVAKVLFTSGSTGLPKGVITTQRMLCANQQQVLQTFPFLAEAPPTTLCWLPWNHTFGGNLSLGLMLYNGGSFYTDDGKPVPGGIDTTVANLRDIAPTFYSNVPKGFEALIPHLERDPALRQRFFSRLQMLHYGGAGLAAHTWQRLEELAVEACGQRVVICTGLGCTEASPAAMFAHWAGSRPGLLGVPVPGLSLKLSPDQDKFEARYRGPNIMPGYWRQPELDSAAFDDEGYYRTGDALCFDDPEQPNRGLLFDGRIAEDFKLDTGTWVSVGSLRAALVAACAPLLQDAVITGLNQPYLGALLFPNLVACRQAVGLDESAGYAELARHADLRQRFQTALDAFATQSTGSANRIVRALLADTAPSLDSGEATDKGSLNQRAVLRQRADQVAALHAAEPPAAVIRVNRATAPT